MTNDIEPKLDLTPQEFQAKLKRLEEIMIKGEALDIKLRIVKKLPSNYEENLKTNQLIETGFPMEKYSQVYQEWCKIHDLINEGSLRTIESMIKIEKSIRKFSSDYFQKIEEIMMKKEIKIKEFFSIKKYFEMRKYNLNSEPIEFIKQKALNAEAYEFLEIISRQ